MIANSLSRANCGDSQASISSTSSIRSQTNLLAIDVLAKVRGGKGREEGNYEADYNTVTIWKALADEFGVAIVLVHHTRKMGADDKLEIVSGTVRRQNIWDSRGHNLRKHWPHLIG